MTSKILGLLAISCAVLCIGVTPAAAYLDPGTGSFVLQMLLASMLALGVSVKLFWYRLKETAQKLIGRGKPNTDVE